MAPPLANQLQQTTPGTLIVFVDFQMLGQLIDPSGQKRNLHFRRSRVGWMDTI